MSSYISHDPRAASRNRVAERESFSADLDISSALISDSVRVVALFARLHARVIFGAALGGTALSLLGMAQGWW